MCFKVTMTRLGMTIALSTRTKCRLIHTIYHSRLLIHISIDKATLDVDTWLGAIHLEHHTIVKILANEL